MIHNLEECYSKTQAYKFLKTLLEIPHNVLIFKDFFNLFFIDHGHNLFTIKQSEEKIKSIFTQNNIAQLNRDFYNNKKENNSSEAMKIYGFTVNVVKDSLYAC